MTSTELGLRWERAGLTGEAVGAGVRVVNPRELQALCAKDRTYARFPQCTPASVLVESGDELEAAFAAIPDKSVALARASTGWPQAAQGMILIDGSADQPQGLSFHR